VLGIVWLFADCEWHNRTTLMGLGIVFLATIVLILKFTIKRSRPPGDWGDVYRSTDPHSFPSGHAARVSYIAVMAVGMGPVWFAIAAVIWAPLVGLARISKGVHYLSDIIAGAFVGIAWGLITLALADFLFRIFSHIPFIVCTASL